MKWICLHLLVAVWRADGALAADVTLTNPRTETQFFCHGHDHYFDEAAKECEKLKDSSWIPAKVISEEDNIFLSDVLEACGGDAWLGLSLNREGKEQWSDGTAVTWRPNNIDYDRDKTCVLIKKYRRPEWVSESCVDAKKYVLCIKVGSTKTVGTSRTDLFINLFDVAESTAAVPTTTAAMVTSPVPDPRKVAPGLLRQQPNRKPCKDDTWAYGNSTGYCYMFGPQLATWNEAIQECKKSEKGRQLEIRNPVDQKFVDEYLMAYNYQDHWVGARRRNGRYVWESGKDKKDTWKYVRDDARWSDGEPAGRDCVYITRPSLDWRWFLKTASCDEKKSVYCQQMAIRCPKVPTARHVIPSSYRPNLEQTVHFRCAAGYYLPDYVKLHQEWIESKKDPNSTMEEPAFKENPTMNITCDYSTGGAEWTNRSLAVADCLPQPCEPLPKIKYARSNVSLGNESLDYPSYVKFECKSGYYFRDEDQTSSRGFCDTNKKWRRYVGGYFPKSCDPLPCDSLETPDQARMYGGENTFVGGIVAFRCKPGFMFPDDKGVWKFSKCGKRPGPELKGWWNETEYPNCTDLVCPEPEKVENATLNNTNRSWKNVIQLNCSDGYELPDSSTSLLVKCTDNAVWQPKLSSCSKIPKKLKIQGRRYQPEPSEAPAGAGIGSTAAIVCLVLIGLIVLLDVSSLTRDCKRMKRNLRHLGKKFTQPEMPKTKIVQDVA